MQPIKVAWCQWPGWYPMAIAKEKGLFEKHGAHIEPIFYSTYVQILPDIGAGELGGGCMGLYEALKSGLPNLRVVMATDFSKGAEGLIALPDIDGPKDLIGKRVGTQGSLSGSEFILTTYLRRAGQDGRELSLIDVPIELVIDKMSSGSIQAGYTWNPFLALAEANGYHVLFTTADTPGMILDVVCFTEDVVKKRHDDIRGFVAAWFEALDFWLRHPEEATRIIADAVGKRPKEVSLAGCDLLNLEDNQLLFSSEKDSIYDIATAQINFFINLGDASSAPNPKDMIDGGFVLNRNR